MKTVVLCFVFTSCLAFSDAMAGEPSPTRTLSWPEEERSHYLALQARMGYPRELVVGSKAMIAGVTDPFAVHAGLEVLKRGGNAVDAGLTTALAQVALNAGAAVSYAGMLSAVYYEAATGQVHGLNAAFNTVRGENQPMTIPAMGSSSGRGALVPGFIAGVEALHRRFGRIPFATIFEPSLWVAEHGIEVNPILANWIKSQSRVVTRLPEGKRIFAKPNGALYGRGDVFRQPDLARTLAGIASEGAAYMYRGEWARRCAALVQREGGKMAVEDLAAYQPTWDDPARISFRDHQIVSLGPPNFGGALSLASLKLAEIADLRRYGRTIDSADALYYQIRIGRTVARLAHGEANPSELLAPETARRLWAEIQSNVKPLPVGSDRSTNHSSGVVVVDESGNVLTLLHSINTVLWGATGIFVDGISIPDPATFQQKKIAEAGPGNRLPESTNPLLVLRNGKPVLASMAIGSGLHAVTLSNVINVLEFGLDPQAAANMPSSRGPPLARLQNPDAARDLATEAVGRGDFPEAVIAGVQARGQPLELVNGIAQLGFWVGIQIDPATGQLRGGVCRQLNGIVEGY